MKYRVIKVSKVSIFKQLLLTGFISVLLYSISIGSEKKTDIFVSIPPQAYLAGRVGGEFIDIAILVGPGQSPATYEISPRQMATLSESDAFFRIGVPFENRLVEKLKRSIRDLNIIDTRQGIDLRPMESHAGNHNHTHNSGEADPHVWLNPINAGIIADNITKELIRLDSNHADYYSRNLDELKSDLDSLDKELTEILKPFAGRKFYVFHPAFGYLAERYNLEQIAIEIEGKEPSARHLTNLIETAQKENIKAIYVQREFSPDAAKAIADAIGGEVIVLDPLARDYTDNMKNMAEKLAEGLSLK